MLNYYILAGAIIILVVTLVFLRRPRDVKDFLYELKTIRIKGVTFKIKKIDVFNYMSGSSVLKKEYDKYHVGGGSEEVRAGYEKKLKAHYRDVILAGVVVPYITRKKEETGIYVDDFFNSWEIANEVYQEIIDFTYGKKKVIQTSLAKKG